MSEWMSYKFSDFVEINPKVRLIKDQVYPFVEMADLESTNKYCESKQERILGGGSRFQNGDTLFARITPCLENGKICQVRNLSNELGFGSTEFHVLRGKEGLSDTDFIFYLSRWSDVRDFAELNLHGTSGRQRMPHDAFKELLINVPPLPEQQAIAEVLSSLDDKIDLLHRNNKTLEEMAETLFRQWFVEGATDKQMEVEDILTINPTYKLQKGSVAPYLEMAGLSESSPWPSGWYLREFTSGQKFMNGDTLLARITPCLENGKTAFVDFLNHNQIGWGSTEYIVMRMKHGFHNFISYLLAKNDFFREEALSSMTGSSGRQRADSNYLKKVKLFMPSDDNIGMLNIQLDDIWKKIKHNSEEIITLQECRDSLLPKLMSGQVRVKS